MTRSKCAHLRISSHGTRHFVEVTDSRSAELHAYLRSHAIICSPPNPCSRGLDLIELGKDMNVKNVKALLDGWA